MTYFVSILYEIQNIAIYANVQQEITVMKDRIVRVESSLQQAQRDDSSDSDPKNLSSSGSVSSSAHSFSNDDPLLVCFYPILL